MNQHPETTDRPRSRIPCPGQQRCPRGCIDEVDHGLRVEDGQRDKLYYLVAYPDREARERRLVNGIAKDPEFLKAVAESEKGGKLTSGTESILLAPTDYSPMR